MVIKLKGIYYYNYYAKNQCSKYNRETGKTMDKENYNQILGTVVFIINPFQIVYNFIT